MFNTRSHGSVFVLVFLLCRGAGAAEPTPPVPGADITSGFAYVGDPLLGLESWEPGSLYWHNADTQAAMASTTKTWTIYVALQAVSDGILDIDDVVPISSNAGTINNGHGVTHSLLGVTTGQSFVLEDLLYGALISSGGDACKAIAEHVAAMTLPATIGQPGVHPMVRELYFVAMMNMAAEKIGLTDTQFENPYGGDHDHALDNTPGALADHYTTAQEMAMWMHHAMQNSLFREFMALRGTWSFTPIGQPWQLFNLNWVPGYPGTQATKGGWNVQADTCVVAQAKRIGRELVCTYLHADGGGDGTTILDYGFGKTFHPKDRGESAGWGFVDDHDLVAVNSKRAASAVVTPEGEAKIILWLVDVDEESIDWAREPRPTRGIDDFKSPEPDDDGRDLGYVSDPGRDELDLAGDVPEDPEPEPSGTIVVAGQNGKILEAEIAHAGDGYLVLATRDENDKIELSCWAIPVEGPAKFRNKTSAGSGRDIELETVDHGQVVLGYLGGADAVILKSWAVDTVAGEIAYSPDDTEVGALYSEFDLASRPIIGLEGHLLVAGASLGNELQIESWTFNGANQLTPKDAVPFAGADAQTVRVARVGGNVGFDDDTYVTARRLPSGVVRLNVITFAADGSIQAPSGVSTTYVIDADGDIALEPYEEGGVLLATKADPTSPLTTMSAWSVDASGTSSLALNFVVDELTAQSEGPVALCRLPTGKAEGDFLVGQNHFFSGKLRLEAFRSGARQ